MKHIFLISLFVSLCAISFCQTGRLTGLVMDAETKSPLELATVTILGTDSSVVAYSLSDKNGKFAIEKLPLKKSLLASITYTGYAAYNKTIQLETAKPDTLSVFLSLNNKDTNAIVVTATIPIRMNGDTLEINPAAFKLKQDAVVEELLNQVSGITIWSDGTITVNGKLVNNLLVDGKPFLGSNDSRVATQNLPKSAIEKIQLYQEYDRSKIGQEKTRQPQDSLLTMNIKLKEGSKKGFFGKAGAGYGTTDRFESDLSFQVYDKKSSAGIGGGFNNINKDIANLQDMFQNNTYRNYNPNLYRVGRFGADGINKNHSIGGVYTHSFIESANSRQNNRIAVNYNKTGTNTSLNDLSLQNSTIGKVQFIREEGVQSNISNRHDFGVNYVKTNSYYDNLTLNGAANATSSNNNSTRYTEVRDSLNQLQSTNNSITTGRRRADNESLSATFAKSDYDNPLKGFSLQVNARRGNSGSERNTISRFISFTDASKDTSFNRNYLTNNESVNVGGNLYYSGLKRLLLGRYNFFRINLNFNQAINYNRSNDNSVVADYDSLSKKYITNSGLSNYNKRELMEYTPSLGLSKDISKWTDKKSHGIYFQLRLLDEIKTDKNTSSLVKRNLTRSFQFFRYDGNVTFSLQEFQKYYFNISANYTKNYDYPSIDQLYTIVDNINVYNIRIGNANLQNRINKNASLNAMFNTQNPKALYSINGNVTGSYGRSLHPVTDSIINDLSGKRTYYYVNADKSSIANFNYSFNISRKLNKSNLQLMYNGQYSSSKIPSYIGNTYNISQTGNLYNRFNVQFTLRSLLVLSVAQSFQRNKSEQTAPELKPFKNNNKTTNFGVVLNYPKNSTLSSTLDRIDNSNLNKQTLLWNAFATYRFMKQQGELKFSAMDLLKQYQNITNSVSSYGTTTRITNGLQQYFLLTLSYYPRKFGKTEIKRQGR